MCPRMVTRRNTGTSESELNLKHQIAIKRNQREAIQPSGKLEAKIATDMYVTYMCVEPVMEDIASLNIFGAR